jgi:integrase
MHSDFTLFLRKYPNGKEVYFYYTYDNEGRRRGPWTTHSLKKTEARNYCHKLIKNGALIPDRKKAMTFGDYADGFWERNSVYVKNQESRGEISDSYIATCKTIVKHQMMPIFASVPLDKITAGDIDKWILGFTCREVIEDGKKVIKQYKKSYANTAFSILNAMFQEAVRRELITKNPCANVRRLKSDRKDMEIITMEEVHKLFPENFKSVWGNKEINYAANKLASLTGMRAGEILGLRGEYVFDDYILVCGQYGDYGYKNYTKTRENRGIPLLPEMIAILRKLMEHNGNGFVFSKDGGVTPVCHTTLYRGLHEALVKIGIGKKEIQRRGLTLHAWRHFVNTDLQRQGLTLRQVQGVTGHKTERMTDRYSHLDARQIEAVIKAQEVINGTAKPDEKKPDGGKPNKKKPNGGKSNEKKPDGGKPNEEKPFNGLKLVIPENTEEQAVSKLA